MCLACIPVSAFSMVMLLARASVQGDTLPQSWLLQACRTLKPVHTPIGIQIHRKGHCHTAVNEGHRLWGPCAAACMDPVHPSNQHPLSASPILGHWN